MNEQQVPSSETQPQQQQQSTPAPAAEASAAPAMDPKEVEEGKPFAILSYALNFVILPFFLVPLIMRNNEFSLYHAKQSLMLWLIGIVGSAIGAMFMVICVGIILLPLLLVFLLILNIIGLVNAIKGEAKPLPVVGKWAEEWFKGLRKV